MAFARILVEGEAESPLEKAPENVADSKQARTRSRGSARRAPDPPESSGGQAAAARMAPMVVRKLAAGIQHMVVLARRHKARRPSGTSARRGSRKEEAGSAPRTMDLGRVYRVSPSA